MFRRNAPAAAPRPWLLALPASYLLIAVPLVALQATGNSAWVPDFSGLCCILVALACLARAPRARSRRSGSPGVWSLALILLAADAAAYRIFSIADYLHDPHLIALPAASRAALLAMTTRAYNSRDQMATIVAGKTWGIAVVMAPFAGGQFEIAAQGASQARQLQHALIPSA
jgi:hypothetical protein